MKIGFIGGGHVAQVLAKLFIGKGHTVVLTNKHGLEKLKPTIERLGSQAQAGNLAEVVRQDVVVLAVPYKAVFEIESQLLQGKDIIDATNYFPHRDGDIEELREHQKATTELVAQHFKGANVVKAFNTIPVADLARLATSKDNVKRVALPIAGNDAVLKDKVASLITEIGFTPYDVGSLADSRKSQSDTPAFLFVGNKEELSKKIGD
ncbi:dinucleotide-binding enzyme [Liquorilactobacillus sucicola DSM 21376 = JCM 15457]|uniref:Dinucleotide-binding protein n=1 Tax=Liquorilactobacillus sucicola DSM 21376 = JCM 15457 TaxID=1423806 RepID=A0A023CXX9_9LACO|nr:NAD(P)-binding domain-containing protein [Liquorilactobacillus sucicola]KRN07644.1 dinucleotide-binding protein [Liquorilactobacillus sucicola DSM 21376 = JCM 15457]GAJ26722.1 dinucleotide-binding enzyme [Liquorilactobacillus sucicola DSM 21376 = JCM 15457]